MTRIPNPWGDTPQPSPIGESLKGLMNTMFAPPADTSRIQYNRAAAAKAAAETDLLRDRRTSMTGLGKLVSDAVSDSMRVAPALNLDPSNDVTLPGNADAFARHAPSLMQSGVQAGFSPSEAGDLLFSTAKQAGLPAEIAARYRTQLIPLNQAVDVGHHDRMRREDAANAVALERSKPHNVAAGATAFHAPGDPRFAGPGPVRGADTLDTVRGRVAADAVDTGNLSPIGRSIIGSTGTPRMYMQDDGRKGVTYDGLHDAATGAPLPAGDYTVGSVQGGPGDFQDSELAKRRGALIDGRQTVNIMSRAIDRLDKQLATADAGQTISLVGGAVDLLNTAVAQVKAASAAAGVPVDETVLDSSKYDSELQRLGVKTAQQRSALISLAFLRAKSHDPGGRITDQDLKRAMEEIAANAGDPTVMRGVLKDVLVRSVEAQQAREEDAFGAYGDRLGIARWQVPGASQAGGQGDQGAAVIRDDAEYESLPSGAEFVGPDGVRRRKP